MIYRNSSVGNESNMLDNSCIWFRRFWLILAFGFIITFFFGLPALLASKGTPYSNVPNGAKWYRGNTHLHTNRSDGDVSPVEATEWYAYHGYQFVVITDHDLLTSDLDLAAIDAAVTGPKHGAFLAIRGEEITQRFRGGKQLHMNGIDLKKQILPLESVKGTQVAPDTYSKNQVFLRNASAVVEAGGLVQINHPNYHWSVEQQDLVGLPDPFLLEIWNGNDNVLGGTDEFGNVSLSTLELWDTLLSRGQIVWGVGSDDTHRYRNPDDMSGMRPGKAWVVVRAESLTLQAVVGSLKAGDFYSSNGVDLANIQFSDGCLALEIVPERDARYRTRFIGKKGTILAEMYGTRCSYKLKNGDGYVRAEVRNSFGKYAWTQPILERK